MATTVNDNPDQHRYEIALDGEVVGFSDYRRQGDRVTFTHTEVDDGHEGQGLARQLVQEMLADAEGRDRQVVPECEYVRKVVADDPDQYLHLVPEDVLDDLDLARLRR